MQFKVIKSSLDGICGGQSAYANIDEALKEICSYRGWGSIDDLRASIREWAKQAVPGSVYPTQVSAIVAVPDLSSRDDCSCPECGCEEVTYGCLEPDESGYIDQVGSCVECGTRFKDRFQLCQRIILSKGSLRP